MTRQCKACGAPFRTFPSRPRNLFCSVGCVPRVRKRLPIEIRFRQYRPPVPDDRGCLPWTGKRNRRGGYGLIAQGAPSRSFLFAHRVAWEMAYGPIPDGLCVLHRCDNPPCCNVAHLFLGTVQDNTDDMLAKGRGHGLSRGADGRWLPRAQGASP